MSEKKDQIDLFKQAARDLDADCSDNALDKIMDRLDLKAKPKHVKTKRDEPKDG